MKLMFSFIVPVLVFLHPGFAFAQQIKFNRVLGGVTDKWGQITGMAQDAQGFIWFTTAIRGLQQYDGSHTKTYMNDPLNSQSLANNNTECIAIDSTGIIWVGTYGSGLDRFDPSTKTFTHFRHSPKDGSSLSNDTVTAMLEDRLGNLWIGNVGGLDLMEKKTGKFVHYANKPNDISSLNYNRVAVIYEDRQGTLWVGCGNPYRRNSENGGLHRFDGATGKFIRYLHDPKNPNSVNNNNVRAIFEDSKGNFWIGTGGDGLHIMDRSKGVFTHYPYDPAHPEKLSRPPLFTADFLVDNNMVTFITEDAKGAIWIGTVLEGMNRYDPVTKKITHFGNIVQNFKVEHADTASGFDENSINSCWQAITTKDGLFWICTLEGTLYNTNPFKLTIPYHKIELDANSFYKENDSILWIATSINGLIRKNLNTGMQEKFILNPKNSNSRGNNFTLSIRADADSNLWIITYGGLNKFDIHTRKFSTYKHDPKNNNSLANDSTLSLHIDHDQNIWIGTVTSGLDKMDGKSGQFTHYRYNDKDSNSLSDDQVNCISEDQNNNIWAGTMKGLNRIDKNSDGFHHYLKGKAILSVCVDASGIVWAGAYDGLYRFDVSKDNFSPYTDPNSQAEINGILHILEDNEQNLWLSTAGDIIKINERRNAVRIYGESYGVHPNIFFTGDNYQAQNGELFIGDQSGYYAFLPDKLEGNSTAPKLNFTSFKLGSKEILPLPGSVLTSPVWEVKEIKLKYNQNIFSFEFSAIYYSNPGGMKYRFMLENYDDEWHDIGTDNKANFFNVPPGTYAFRVKTFNSDGAWSEKAIAIIITPPWWKTWWAYTIFTLLFVSAVWGVIYYRSSQLRRENRILEEKVTHRTTQLKQSLDDLKSTQAQLIQSEKMASLGALTAGIAHEIQNPLNFVNNFSEVNTELLTEMKDEMDRGNIDDAKAIANDAIENQKKINHHGKRADSIVKGMLQHSQASTGKKEPSNINALADEYLRLSYHGMRAKNKNFNATLKTEFDEHVGNIYIIPQEIGRVLLNLCNNAFYAVAEKMDQKGEGYDPTVSVSTKRINDRVEISVKDNGSGIPQKVLDKIFQPFFTTKPTGQGTGLGLSLAYDIIKAHGGDITVESKENEGVEFTVVLPG